MPIGSIAVALVISGDRAAGHGAQPAARLPPAVRGGLHRSGRALGDADRGDAAVLHGPRRGRRLPGRAVQHRRRGPALHGRDRGGGRGAGAGRPGRPCQIAAMVVGGRRRGRGLGADPRLPAGVREHQRDHHLADAQLRRRAVPQLPDLRHVSLLARHLVSGRRAVPAGQGAAGSGHWPTFGLGTDLVVPFGLLVAVVLAVVARCSTGARASASRPP